MLNLEAYHTTTLDSTKKLAIIAGYHYDGPNVAYELELESHNRTDRIDAALSTMNRTPRFRSEVATSIWCNNSTD